jgi:hypothetical protein
LQEFALARERVKQTMVGAARFEQRQNGGVVMFLDGQVARFDAAIGSSHDIYFSL